MIQVADIPTKDIHQGVVYLRILIVALGGLFYGFNNGSFNTAQQHICYMNQWYSESEMALYSGFITSALPLGCLIGSLISAKFLKMTHSDYRFCLVVTDIIGIIGIVEQILDYNLGHFLLGRLLAGIAGGLNTSIFPSYLNNFSPIIMRGKTGTFFQTLAQFGSFLAIALNEIQPKYTKAPAGMSSSLHIIKQIEAQGTFQNAWAWRLTIGVMIFVCLFRAFCLLFVYTEATAVQLAQHQQLKTLKQYLLKIYTKERAHKRYVEILQYVHNTKDEDAIPDEGIPDDENDNHDDEKKQVAIKINSIGGEPGNHQEHLHETEGMYKKDDNLITNNIHTYHDVNEVQALKTQVQMFRASIDNKQSLHPVLVQKEKQQQEKMNSQKSTRRRLMLGIVCQTATQLSGLNALIFFSKSIYQAASDNTQTVQMYMYIQGFSGFFFTFISIFFVEKYGRRKLILFSSFLVVIGLFGIAIFALLDIFIISFISIIFYLFGFGIGLGGATWPFITELVNKSDVNLCSSVRWFWAFVIGITFRFILNAIGISGSFFIFFGCSLACFLYLLKEIKDTKGLTIEQVDTLFATN